MGLIHRDIKPANILAGTSGYRGHEEDVMTETHGHAFDVYSMGAPFAAVLSSAPPPILEIAGSEATPWIRICAAHSAAAGGGILRTTASDGAAGSASTALPPLTDSTALPPPPPLAAASPAAPRSRSGLGPAAKAALVLMLQCQEDTAARAALAGSPDGTAAEMLQSGSALEQRITAHLFWFTSRSQEGAAALFGETHGATPSTPRPEAPTPAAPAAAAESPAPVPGALLAATRCQDAHAAKAVAMALHNVLVSEGGAAAVEVARSGALDVTAGRRAAGEGGDWAGWQRPGTSQVAPAVMPSAGRELLLQCRQQARSAAVDAAAGRRSAGEGGGWAGSTPVPAKSSDK
ncbi:hypothetical protein PLESTM_000069500 [Pleodorina starrii]|nr:hypothetical protein PLESTM_000069500 [Pleodorina starrii]